MKKIALIAAAAITLATQAHASNLQYKFGVYDKNTRATVSTQKVTRSDSSQLVCWSVFSDTASLRPTVNIKETFKTPVGSKFNDADSVIQSSLDGSSHTISTVKSTVAQSAVERCWTFSNNDPAGQYTLTVQIDDKPVGMTSFEVVP